MRATSTGLPLHVRPWQERIDAVLDTLDLLAVPSQNEGMPRVILEAFSAGVPVIAFPAGGIPEIIRDGETGFLVEEVSAPGLANRIVRLLQHERSVLPGVAAAARLRWEERHQVAAYQAAVAELMARCAAARAQSAQTAGQR
jgi:glycosyltransferase involved in cell wall biosynthesis